MTKQTRVLIADDRRPSRSGLRVVLAVRPEIVIVGEAADGQEAVRLVATPSWSSDARPRNGWKRSWTVRVDDLASHRKKKEE
jgi:CheY-like chemotaxis protein